MSKINPYELTNAALKESRSFFYFIPQPPLHITSECVAIHIDTGRRTPDIKPVFLSSKAWPSLDSLVSDALER